MSKSKLRQEYEARMGTVEGNFELFNAEGLKVYHEHHSGFWVKHEYNDAGNPVYHEDSDGCWFKREYNDKGTQVYFENSDGMVRDNRPKRPKLWTDENGVQYKLTEVRK